jgi:hypothetical protein
VNVVQDAERDYPLIHVTQEELNASIANIRLARTAYLPRVDGLAQFNQRQMQKPEHKPFRPQGICNGSVPGLRCNACPGTLTSQEGLVSLLGAQRMDCFSVSFWYLGTALRTGTSLSRNADEEIVAGTTAELSNIQVRFYSATRQTDGAHSASMPNGASPNRRRCWRNCGQ